MRKQDVGFDFHRYRQLLAEAVDEKRRLAFIDLLVEERAREQLEAQRAAERIAMTATTIAEMLGAKAPDLAHTAEPLAKPLRAVEHPGPAIARLDNSR